MRRDRWLRLHEVIALLAERYPDLLAIRPASQRKKVRRIIRRAELRDGERYSRWYGRELVVSRNALESLLPYDGRVVANMERGLSELAQNHRTLKRQVNAHGARIGVLERKQALTSKYLADVSELDGTGTGQERDKNHYLNQ